MSFEADNGEAHFPQKFVSPGLSNWHLGHFMGFVPFTADWPRIALIPRPVKLVTGTHH
jgi:hypothetical protein